MGQPRPLFCSFSSFSQYDDKFNIQFVTKLKKHRCCAWDSIPGCRMRGTDGATELLRPPNLSMFVQVFKMGLIALGMTQIGGFMD